MTPSLSKLFFVGKLYKYNGKRTISKYLNSYDRKLMSHVFIVLLIPFTYYMKGQRKKFEPRFSFYEFSYANI